MRRRDFVGVVGALAVSLTAVADSQAGYVRELEFELIDGFNLGIVKASGRPHDVCKFIEAYQDALWPDWRGNEATVKIVEASKLVSMESGYAYFAVGLKITRQAFEAASGRSVDSLKRVVRGVPTKRLIFGCPV